MIMDWANSVLNIGKRVGNLLGFGNASLDCFSGIDCESILHSCLRFEKLAADLESGNLRPEQQRACQTMMDLFVEEELPKLEKSLARALRSTDCDNVLQAANLLTALARGGAFDGRKI